MGGRNRIRGGGGGRNFGDGGGYGGDGGNFGGGGGGNYGGGNFGGGGGFPANYGGPGNGMDPFSKYILMYIPHGIKSLTHHCP